MVAYVGDVQHRVGGELLEADPESYLVDRRAPVGGECVDRGGDDEQFAALLPWDRQVVLAERPGAELTDHRTDCHPEHRRREHRAQSGHHGEGGVVVLAGTGRRPLTE